MCMQCATDAMLYGQPIPGWTLMRAQKNDFCEDMKAGQWGLLTCNNPDFIWTVDPVKDPTAGMTDAEVEAFTDDVAQNKFIDALLSFEKDMFDDPFTGWSLVEAARKAGYDPERGGWRFNTWLFDRLARWIENHPPYFHANDVPDLKFYGYEETDGMGQ